MAFILKNRPKLNSFLIAIGLVIIGLFVFYKDVSFLEFIELKTIDARFLSRGEKAPGKEVVLAAIDEKSLEKEGRWPWPRSKIADLIYKLSENGAKVVALDIGFFEKDSNDTYQMAGELRKKVESLKIDDRQLHEYLQEIENRTDHDRILAEAIKNSHSKIVLGYYFDFDSEYIKEAGKDTLRYHRRNIRRSKYTFDRYIPVNEDEKAPGRNPFTKVGVPNSNIPAISKGAPYSGYFNMKPDKDGHMRWLPAVVDFDDRRYAPLSIMALRAYLDQTLSIEWSDFGVNRVKIGEFSIPTSEYGNVMINYRGRGGTFPHYSITDILHNNVPKKNLENKIVIVGATAVGLRDIKTTPFDEVFPGPEIHATIIDTILTGDFLYYPAGYQLLTFAAIIGIGLLLGIVLPITGGVTGLVFFMVISIGYCYLARFLFCEKGLILNMVYPMVTYFSIYILITVYKYFSVEKQRRFIQSAFSTYLAPSVVDQLIESPEKLNLGGEQRNITAFFSDVEGFTSISEKLEPKALVDLLNEYLTEMEEIIQKHFGIVDKYEGDAIIAIFGAPNQLDNHAEKACLASIEMQKRLEELRTKWNEEGKPEVKMRIGLCTGNAVVGNMGSNKRMDYTMMGDTVNIAARLEGNSKAYQIYTLISDSTFQAAGSGFVVREIDAIKVVGKKKPVTIYQLIGSEGDVPQPFPEVIKLYEKALVEYRKRNFKNAKLLFENVLEVSPEDGPSHTMLARCDLFIENPPDNDWDGTFTMQTK